MAQLFVDSIFVDRNELFVSVNHTLDTKKFNSYHKGHICSHIEFELAHFFENIFVDRNEFLGPQNPTLDTIIIVLGGLVIEVWYSLGPGSHFGSHLEFVMMHSFDNILFLLVKLNALAPKTPP